ncbi:MAG: ABC transporter permease [Leptospiraceae bacterium]|nr:ABC transporter permease [Leptospiraceae bacterium]MDW8307056.1 ABC transporter permease [Leptospiraceae bacterium]
MKLSHLSAFSRVVINQIRFTGSQALPLISLIALLLGGGTIIQAVTFLPRVGREDFLGNLLKLVIVRELGPLITAIIVLTRSGSAIASELATQKLHREIEALELMGINTHMLMVLPRVIAGFVAVNILVVYFDFIAFVGGYAIAYMVSAFPFESFLENLIRSLSMEDLLSSLSKATILGISIPLLCSFYGLKPETLFEIPIFVSRAVVRSLIVVFSANALLSVIFYL